MGKIREEFRLPLCEMAPANREKLKEGSEGHETDLADCCKLVSNPAKSGSCMTDRIHD